MTSGKVRVVSIVTIILLVLATLSLPTFAKKIEKGGQVAVHFYEDGVPDGGSSGGGTTTRPERPDGGSQGGGSTGGRDSTHRLSLEPGSAVEVIEAPLEVRERRLPAASGSTTASLGKLPATGSNNLLVASLLTISALSFGGYAFINRSKDTKREL